MNKSDLIKNKSQLSKDEVILFFHEYEENGFLSQWYKSEFYENGIKFTSAEQYMMYKKAELFNDDEVKQKIINSSNQKDIKHLGREVKNFDEEKWNENKLKIVLQGNILKFSQNKKIKELLISTNNKILIEASPFDKIWGIKLSKDNPDCLNPNLWLGENYLGFILMKTRNLLKETL